MINRKEVQTSKQNKNKSGFKSKAMILDPGTSLKEQMSETAERVHANQGTP